MGNDISVNGGVGSGERIFPPQSGLSYSTWIYIDKFGTPLNPQTTTASAKSTHVSVDSTHVHPIRLLTLIKHSKLRDTLTSCLTVYLSPKSRSLFISTEETLLSQQKLDQQGAKLDHTKLSDYTAMFNCAELFEEGQWLHIALVWSRAVLKNSSVTLYVNSHLIGSTKLHYVNSNLSGGANATPASMSVHAVIGTLPMFRLQSPVVWRQASCHLFEDILSAQTVQSIYRLGPNYIGSMQSLPITNDLSDSQASNQTWVINILLFINYYTEFSEILD